MAKLKVSQLPKEEQDKLIAEAQQYNIGGILTAYGVETLEKKIEDAKAKANGQNEENNSQGGQNNEEIENAGNDEQNDAGDEQNDGDDEQTPPDDKQNDGGVNADAVPDNGTEVETDDGEPTPKRKQTFKICHICRSKVIDGKCTGCGFTL